MLPKDNGFAMPAEWAEHDRTFISWPVKESLCFSENYDEVCKGYRNVIHAVAEFEPAAVIVNPGKTEEAAGLCTGRNIELLTVAHNDAWIRDNGPTFLLNGTGDVAAVNWRFNAWGEKYPGWELDNRVAPEILRQYGVNSYDAPLIMEGGSFHVDGEGTLITTEQCLLNANRNRESDKAAIEGYLKSYLGIDKVIWLREGLFGDETDGHVDNAACFAAPGKLIVQVCTDKNDENYEICRENIEILKGETDAGGRKFEIIELVQPPRREYRGGRLTLSYINYALVNGGIILPVFGGKASATDALAEETLQSVFPERRIRCVDGMPLIKEGGNVHCITQQMPKPNAEKKKSGVKICER